MPQVDSNRPLIKRSTGIARQSDHGALLPDPQQVGMPNLVPDPIGHDQPKRLKGLLPQKIAKFLGSHESGSQATYIPPALFQGYHQRAPNEITR